MKEIVVGVISDTHGVIRPQAIDALRGCDLLIHAGDIGDPDVLERLRALAPLTVVRGNIDNDAWATRIPPTEVVEVDGRHFYVLHDLAQLDLDPVAAGFAVVVSGHSHRPATERRQGVLYLNPGSAGPRRFRLPVTVALVRVTRDEVRPEIVDLHVASLRSR
jgi:putative phosphoesterase